MPRTVRLGATFTAVLALVVAGAAPALAGDPAPDVTAPVIASTGLTDGQLVPKVGFFFPSITDDVGVTKVTVAVNGLTNYGGCQFTVVRPVVCRAGFYQLPGADGSDVDVTLTAYDLAGNASQPATTRVHIDAVAPTGTLTPAPRSAMRSGPVTTSLSGLSDDVAKVDVTDGTGNGMGSGAVLATLTAAPWSYTWNATETGTPPCFIIYDRAGNVTGICSEYIVADEPPVIQQVVAGMPYATFVLDGGSGWVSWYATLSATVIGRAPVGHFEWWVDGVLKGSGDNRFVNYQWLDTNPQHTSAAVELRVWDGAGNEATKAFRVSIDNVAPTLTVTPGYMAPVRGSRFTTTATATDVHGLGFLNLNGGDYQPTAAITTRASLLSGRDGVRTFSWLAIDKLGNQRTVRRSVIIDNTAPSLSVTKAPANNSRLRSPVTITATATDRNGISRVQMLVNGRVAATDSSAGYAFTLNPRLYGTTFTMQLRAYDKAGNVRYSTTRTYHR